MDDLKIIDLMQNRDTRGLEALIEKYRRLACSLALTVLGSGAQEDALECVNSAFYDAWMSIPRYDMQRSSLKGWIALLTRRRAIDQLRKNQRRFPSAAEFDEDILGTPDSCEDYINRETCIELFNKFVQSLPEPDKSIFVRRFFALESIPDIARRYGLTRGAVDSRLTRMRKSLKLTLEGSLRHEG